MNIELLKAELAKIRESLDRIVILLTAEPEIPPLPPPEPAVIVFRRLGEGIVRVGGTFQVEWQTEHAIRGTLEILGNPDGPIELVGETLLAGTVTLTALDVGEATITLTAYGVEGTEPDVVTATVLVDEPAPQWPGVLDFTMSPDPTKVAVGPNQEITFEAVWREPSPAPIDAGPNPAYSDPPASEDFDMMLDRHTHQVVA